MHNIPERDLKSQLLDAALGHVAFDGWSAATFDAAVADCELDAALANLICPRGALDLAVAYHKRGDQLMLAQLHDAELSEMRFRDRIAAAVRFRLEVSDDKEAVRRGSTLFALPQHAALGAQLIWDTCDAIWTALGDTSEDVNWYTKRATLSGVYGTTVLYWLGDDSDAHEATWAFLDRRIDNVMQFEKAKAQFKASPMSKALAGPLSALGRLRAPKSKMDLPGQTTKGQGM